MTGTSEQERFDRYRELNNSRPLDVWRLSEYPEAKVIIDKLFSEFEETGLSNTRYRKKFRDCMRAVLLDLFVAYKQDPTMYIAFPKRSNDFGTASRYRALFFTFRVMDKVVDKFLIKRGYVEYHKGIHDSKNSGRKSYRSRMRASDKLINIFEGNEVKLAMMDRDEDEEIIILRDADKEDIGYEDTENTIRMRENLKLINKNLMKHAILLDVWDEDLKIINDGLKEKGKIDQYRRPIDFTRKKLKRVFNNGSWTQGGRFYGGWWQGGIPRECRKYININGKDCVECDYSGLHINMLYAMEKLPMPEGDVYHLDGYSNDKTFRDFVKIMLLVMLNAKNRNLARGAMYEMVNGEVEKLILPAEIGSTRGDDLYPLMDAFEEKHHPIKNYFCKSKGVDLQYLDSQIAEQVLLKFSKMGYAILPLHDSFIIHHGLEQELKDAMNEAFKDLFGVESKVDLKYNTIKVRQKESEYINSFNEDPDYDPNICPTDINELFEEMKCSSTFNDLLQDHYKYGD